MKILKILFFVFLFLGIENVFGNGVNYESCTTGVYKSNYGATCNICGTYTERFYKGESTDLWDYAINDQNKEYLISTSNINSYAKINSLNGATFSYTLGNYVGTNTQGLTANWIPKDVSVIPPYNLILFVMKGVSWAGPSINRSLPIGVTEYTMLTYPVLSTGALRNTTYSYLSGTVMGGSLNSEWISSSGPKYIGDPIPHKECFVMLPASCGDGTIDGSNGEVCDDGNLLNGDGCNNTCKIEPIGIDVIKTDANTSTGDLDGIIGNDTQTNVQGQKAVFKITVTNNSTEGLKNITLSDAVEPSCNRSTLQTQGLVSLVGNRDLILDSGESFTYTCERLNTQNNYVNTILVNGIGYISNRPVNDSDPTNVIVSPLGPSIDVIKTDSNTLTNSGDLDGVIGNDTQEIRIGEKAIFKITITNNGNDKLTNVFLTDIVEPSCERTSIQTVPMISLIGNLDNLLDPGESFSYTCEKLNTTANYTNTISVSGLGVVTNQTVTDTDPTQVVTHNVVCNSVSANPNTGNAPIISNFVCSATNASTYKIEIFSGATLLTTINTSTGSYNFTTAGTYIAKCTIDGNITSSACQTPVTVNTPPSTPPSCGTAGGYSFAYSDTNWLSTHTFCTVGTPSPNPPPFPNQGSTTNWTCNNNGNSVSCSANRGSPGGGSSSCFPAGTKISMGDGTYKNIEDVKVGDQVLSYDEIQGKKINTSVLELENPIRDHMCYIKFVDGTDIKLTMEHPVYTLNGWKSIDPNETLKENASLNAEKLLVGDYVLKSTGYKKVEDIFCKSEIVQTYNLKKVKNYYTFYAEDVLVHNKGSGSGPSCVRISIPALEAAGNGKAMSSTGSITYVCYGNSSSSRIGIDCDLDGNGGSKNIDQQDSADYNGGTYSKSFTCTYNSINILPHPKCYVGSSSTTITTSSVSSLTCETSLSVGSGGGVNKCGDGVVQRPNSAGFYEECDSSGAYCNVDCTINNITTPSVSPVVIYGEYNVIMGQGSDPIEIIRKGGESGYDPHIKNESNDDVYIKYPLCLYKTDINLNGPTTYCSSTIGWLYPGTVKSLEYPTYKIFTGAIVPLGSDYIDSVLKITFGNIPGFDYYIIWPYLTKDINVRVSKPAIATVGGGTTLIKKSTSTANINKVASNLPNGNQNKNFVGAGISTGSISSYSKTVTGSSSVTSISSGQTNQVNLNINKAISSVTAPSGNIDLSSVNTNYNGLSNVYIVKGQNLNITSNYTNTVAKTYIVEGGNLIIRSNIICNENIAFVVKGGNIEIDPNVTSICGTFITIPVGLEGGNFKSISDITSEKQLIINGSLYGDVSSLVSKRTYIKNQTNDVINVGTIVSFGSNLFRKTAPLVGDFIGEYMKSKKVAK